MLPGKANTGQPPRTWSASRSTGCHTMCTPLALPSCSQSTGHGVAGILILSQVCPVCLLSNRRAAVGVASPSLPSVFLLLTFILTAGLESGILISKGGGTCTARYHAISVHLRHTLPQQPALRTWVYRYHNFNVLISSQHSSDLKFNKFSYSVNPVPDLDGFLNLIYFFIPGLCTSLEFNSYFWK